MRGVCLGRVRPSPPTPLPGVPRRGGKYGRHALSRTPVRPLRPAAGGPTCPPPPVAGTTRPGKTTPAAPRRCAGCGRTNPAPLETVKAACVACNASSFARTRRSVASAGSTAPSARAYIRRRSDCRADRSALPPAASRDGSPLHYANDRRRHRPTLTPGTTYPVRPPPRPKHAAPVPPAHLPLRCAPLCNGFASFAIREGRKGPSARRSRLRPDRAASTSILEGRRLASRLPVWRRPAPLPSPTGLRRREHSRRRAVRPPGKGLGAGEVVNCDKPTVRKISSRARRGRTAA